MFQPVSLLILDINMPIITGLQAAAKIKELYENVGRDKGGSKIIRPLIVFLSQLDYGRMLAFTYENEQADIFFPKPISMDKLEHILRLVKFT